MNTAGRPTKQEQATIAERNKNLVKMSEKGYPLDYIANYFNISKSRVVQIIQENKLNHVNKPDLE